jgi:hypothetical protein
VIEHDRVSTPYRQNEKSDGHQVGVTRPPQKKVMDLLEKIGAGDWT